MNGAVIAVGALVITVAGSEVEAAGNLFIKQGILDGAGNIGIDADGKLPNIARTFVGVENLIAAHSIGAGRFHDLSVPEGQARAFKHIPLIEAGRVVLEHPVHAVSHGRGVDFPVGDIELAIALDRRHSGDGKAQVRAGSLDVYFIGALHAGGQCIHGMAHLVIIKSTHVKVEVLKRLGAHARLLGHGRGGIAQHDPARIRHTDQAVHRLAVMLHVQALLLRRHIGLLVGVCTRPQADIGVYGTHAVGIHTGFFIPFLSRCAQHQRALNPHVTQNDDRLCACRICLTNQCRHRLRLYAEILDQHALARLEGARIANQLAGKGFQSGVLHGFASFPIV